MYDFGCLIDFYCSFKYVILLLFFCIRMLLFHYTCAILHAFVHFCLIYFPRHSSFLKKNSSFPLARCKDELLSAWFVWKWDIAYAEFNINLSHIWVSRHCNWSQQFNLLISLRKVFKCLVSCFPIWLDYLILEQRTTLTFKVDRGKKK